MSIEIFSAVFADWADGTIPQPVSGPLCKLKKEAAELAAKPSLEEAADVLMCLLYWVHLAGYSVTDLETHAWMKLDKNRGRIWRQDDDQSWSHVPGSSSAGGGRADGRPDRAATDREGTVSDYPEHDKLRKISDLSQAQGEFVEWLSRRGILLAEYADIDGYRDPHLMPTYRPVTDLLAEYHGIDKAALEREKRAMLASIRAS